jgi:hypothetical protein
MLPEIQAEFLITGVNVAPDEITDAIGVMPTRTWKMGEIIEKTTLPRKQNGWCLSTGYHHDFDLGKQAKDLLQSLLPKSELISSYCREHGLRCELACVIYLIDETPSVNFDDETISGFAKLNASIDVDIILIAK